MSAETIQWQPSDFSATYKGLELHVYQCGSKGWEWSVFDASLEIAGGTASNPDHAQFIAAQAAKAYKSEASQEVEA